MPCLPISSFSCQDIFSLKEISWKSPLWSPLIVSLIGGLAIILGPYANSVDLILKTDAMYILAVGFLLIICSLMSILRSFHSHRLFQPVKSPVKLTELEGSSRPSLLL